MMLEQASFSPVYAQAMRSLIATFMLMFPILHVDSQYDIYSKYAGPPSHLSVRSPMEDSQEDNRGAQDNRIFQFQGQQGAVVLTDVGKFLQKKQRAAEEERASAHQGYGRAHAKAKEAEKDQYMALRLQDKMYASKKAHHWWSEAEKQERLFFQALRTKEQTGEDIKNIGLVNREMRGLMMKAFQPLPMPGREARTIREKAGGPKEAKRRYQKSKLGKQALKSEKPIFNKQSSPEGKRSRKAILAHRWRMIKEAGTSANIKSGLSERKRSRKPILTYRWGLTKEAGRSGNIKSSSPGKENVAENR